MTARYAQLMIEQPAHLILKLDTEQPIELGAFVGVFTAIGNEFERMIAQEHPSARGSVEFYVREVRTGCVEADIFPVLVGGAALLLPGIGNLMLVEDFVRRWGKRITALVRGDKAEQPQTKPELKDFLNAVSAIATDPQSTTTLQAAVFEDGERKITAKFSFTAQEAREARKEIDARKLELDKKEGADRERVLMVFTRPDSGTASVGKPSGERVLIDEISEKPMALTYGSNLAQERIKHELREANENIFRLGFLVDVNVQSAGGKPRAYSVTHVHQVIVLDDD